MSHTIEPWRTTELDRVIADRMEKVNDDYFIADCFGPDAKANARRIADCVNACAGINSNVLSDVVSGEISLFHLEAMRAISQRDELLQALSALCEKLPKGDHLNYYCNKPELIAARAVIAKCSE